jgi:hypothetical protein
MLTGGSGTGKSALLCKAALQFEEDGALVLPFHCGLSPRTSLVENLLRMGIWQLTSLPELAGQDGASGFPGHAGRLNCVGSLRCS